MEANISAVQREISSGSKRKLLIDSTVDSLHNLDGDNKKQLHHLKYSELKRSLNSGQTRLQLLQSLESDDYPNLEETDRELGRVSKELAEVKREFDDVLSNMQSLGDQAEQLTNERRNQQEELHQCLEEVKLKQARICQEFGPLDASEADLDSKLGEVEETVQQVTESGEAQLQARLASQQDAITRLEEEVEIIQAAMDTVAKAGQAASLQQDRVKWHQDMLKLVTLCGVRERGIDGTKWTIELCGPTSGGGSTSQGDEGDQGTSLLVQMDFGQATKATRAVPVLESVQLSVPDLEADEVIKTAVQENDVCHLLSELQTIWMKQYPLLSEIDNLRERFAIDWLQEEGRMSVLYGKSSNIICTLDVNQANPKGHAVTLKHIEGIGADVNLAELKPSAEDPTLTDWLEYLKDKFENHS